MTNQNPIEAQSKPWYKEFWPWFIIAFPATSVVLGITMLILALNTNNSLVVDDYYKQGKAINQRIARDRMASELRVNAVLTLSEQGIKLHISVPGQDGNLLSPDVLAPEFELRWTHVTQSEKDGVALLKPIGAGNYSSLNNETLPKSGRFRMHLQPAGDVWRLVSPVIELNSLDSLLIKPAELAVPGVAS